MSCFQFLIMNTVANNITCLLNNICMHFNWIAILPPPPPHTPTPEELLDHKRTCTRSTSGNFA